MHADSMHCIYPPPFWFYLVHLLCGTSVPFLIFALQPLLPRGTSFLETAATASDQQQAHRKHWLWNQLRSENRTPSAIIRRVGVFHQELHHLAINDVFVAIKPRLRGEFLAGFVKDAEGILLGSPPGSPSSSSNSSSATSSSAIGSEPAASSGLHRPP